MIFFRQLRRLTRWQEAVIAARPDKRVKWPDDFYAYQRCVQDYFEVTTHV